MSVLTLTQDTVLYQQKCFANGEDRLSYRLLLPDNYDSSKKYPFILFLHGAGERGNDNKRQLTHAGSFFLKDNIRKNFPAIVVFPQCSFTSFWSNVQFGFDTQAMRPVFNFQNGGLPTTAMDLTVKLVYKLLSDLPVKKDQVYVGGLSMGGMGTFEIVKRMPGVFAAAFPICGGANPLIAPALTRTAWWVFHGQKDPVVPINLSRKMVDALKDAGANVKLTQYPFAYHNSWVDVFKEPQLMPWLLSQRLKR